MVFDHVDEERVLVKGEPVADSSSSQQDGVKQVLVCVIAIAQTFPSVEEKGDVNPLLGTLLLEPE